MPLTTERTTTTTKRIKIDKSRQRNLSDVFLGQQTSKLVQQQEKKKRKGKKQTNKQNRSEGETKKQQQAIKSQIELD